MKTTTEATDDFIQKVFDGDIVWSVDVSNELGLTLSEFSSTMQKYVSLRHVHRDAPELVAIADNIYSLALSLRISGVIKNNPDSLRNLEILRIQLAERDRMISEQNKKIKALETDIKTALEELSKANEQLYQKKISERPAGVKGEPGGSSV